jgi:SagB-type dehydrogenase family enzyme
MRRKRILSGVIGLVFLIGLFFWLNSFIPLRGLFLAGFKGGAVKNMKSLVVLPEPKLKGEVSVEEAIKKRRSRRDFREKSLSKEQISQVLWAAQGFTEDSFRASPSAGATYPLEIYLIVGENGVENMKEAFYHYLPQRHSLELFKEGDFRRPLAQASWGQNFIAKAPVSLIMTAEYARTTGKYGERGIRYVHIEIGHVGENVYLQAEALGLGTVAVGAFSDESVSRVLSLPKNQKPLYIMPVGYPR